MFFYHKLFQYSFYLILLLFISLSILSCESNQCKSCDQIVPLHVKRYNQEGHSYTVFALAKIANLSDEIAYNLAVGSQLPDVLEKYTAFNIEWGDMLHSFHGGDGDAVNYRREVLLNLIEKSFIEKKIDYIQIGIYIHALGDAYAHTKELEDGSIQSYGALLGHVLDGINPDFIALYKEKYLLYTSALLEILGGDFTDEAYQEFESYIYMMDEQNPLNAAEAFRDEIVFKYGFNTASYVTMLNQAEMCVDDIYMQRVLLEIETSINK